MNKIISFKSIAYLVFILAFSPLPAESAPWDSVTLASYKKTELDRKDISAIISLLDSDAKKVLRKDKEKLELLIRKEAVRKYLIAEANKIKLHKKKTVALQMNTSADHELYRSYLLEQNKVSNSYPNQKQLTRFYSKNIKQFTVPEQVHLRQIYLEVKQKKHSKKQLAEARRLLKKIKKGKKAFADYAKSRSDHKESAQNGGDMGWASINTLIPEIRNSVKSMSKKERLKLVQTPAGIHLIELLETRPASTIPLANIKQALISKMRLQKQEELQGAYLSEVRKKNKLSINNFDLLKNAIYATNRDDFVSRLNIIVASMGSVQLSLGDFLEKIDALKSMQTDVSLNMDDTFIKQTLIGNLLLKRFIIKKAKKSRWNRRDDIKLRINRASNDVLVQAMLEKISEPPSSFPSSQQLKSAYESNKEKLVRPEQVHLAQIFVVRSKDSDQNRKLSNGVRDLHKLLIKQPNSFSELAKKYSQNQPSKSNGGDLGWLTVATLLPPVLQEVKKMKLDSISPVIKTEQGWHIVKLLERRQAGQIPLKEARPMLIKSLRTAEKNRLIQQNINAMIFDKSISINQDEMGALIKGI